MNDDKIKCNVIHTGNPFDPYILEEDTGDYSLTYAQCKDLAFKASLGCELLIQSHLLKVTYTKKVVTGVNALINVVLIALFVFKFLSLKYFIFIEVIDALLLLLVDLIDKYLVAVINASSKVHTKFISEHILSKYKNVENLTAEEYKEKRDNLIKLMGLYKREQ